MLGCRSVKKFEHIHLSKLIPAGFFSLGLAAMFEMIDHFNTKWIYINHTSILNWLFYSCLSIGLTLFSIATLKRNYLIMLNLVICFTSIFSYWYFGKSTAIFFQIFISLFLIYSWTKRFKDWIFIGYPIFGILITTLFGTILSKSSNQIWHIFIGPSGSVSVIIFYLILKRSKNNLELYINENL